MKRSKAILWWRLWQLSTGHAETRKRAIKKLAASGNQGAPLLLVAELMDRDRGVEEAAAQALAKIGIPAIPWIAAALEGNAGGRQTFDPLKLLQPSGNIDPSAVLRAQRRAVELLRQIGDARAVEPLVKALEVDGLQVEAAKTLGDLGDARAVEPLIAALRVKSSYVRSAVANALGKIGHRRALGPLITALLDPDDECRKSVRNSLDRVECDWTKSEVARAATPALIEALQHRDWNIRRAAGEALELLGWQPAREVQRVWFAVARQKWDEAARLGRSAVEPLLEVLIDPNADVRRGAAKALGEIGEPRAAEQLVRMLKDDVLTVRMTAADALVKLGGPAIAVLIRELTTPKEREVRTVLDAIDPNWRNSSDITAAVPSLTAAFDDDPEARGRIVRALVWSGEPAIDLKMFESTRCVTGRLLVEVLKRVTDERVVGKLVSTLADDKAYLWEDAVKTLHSLGWHPSDDTECALEAVALREWERATSLGSAAVPPLVAALHSPVVSDAAARVLSELNDPRGVATLIAAASRGNVSAAKALVEIGNMSGLRPLADWLHRTENITQARQIRDALCTFLEKEADNVSLEDLRCLADLKWGITHEQKNWHPYEEIYEITRDEVNFAQLIRLSREELRSRDATPNDLPAGQLVR